MKKNSIKVCAASPRIRLCDTVANTDNMISAAREASAIGAELLVFPELSVTGATAADLYRSETLTLSAKAQIEKYAGETKDCELVSLIGSPVCIGDMLFNCAIAVSKGEVLAVIPRADLPNTLAMRAFDEPSLLAQPTKIDYISQDVPFDKDIKLSVGGLTVTVAFELISRHENICNADICAVLTAIPKTVGSSEEIKEKALGISGTCGCAVVVATAGEGESGTDALYSPQNIIAENGRLLAAAEAFSEEAMICAEVGKTPAEECPLAQTAFYQSPKSPFMPDDEQQRERVCSEIFEIQSRALAGRIKRAHAKCTVIGVSGGLDSTLAVLVAVRAADILGMDRRTVKAVTMPCFGTTSRTKSNAERLSLALGTDFKTVDIKRSVSTHFEDIGHSADDFSVVYENAQARERTQVIMDIANAEGGMVIGTGDLSELVLGWATYNGDHMSMYGVNAGIPKTVIRHLTAYCADKAEREGDIDVAAILRDVLNTPVSPELLPPKDGEIAQCTEGIVGPYELHDFFLFHLLSRQASPSLIYSLAKKAFAGEYSDEVIKGWLRVFFKRFFAQQFKRSCLPDGPMIYDISVSPRGGLAMPSDAAADIWLSEIDALD